MTRLIFVLLVCPSFVGWDGEANSFKGRPPKWHSKTPLPQLTELCRTEKIVQEKIKVCQFAIAKYAELDSQKIPPEASTQAQGMIEFHQNHPQNEAVLFGLHDAHQVLGRIALKDGKVESAKEELRKSLEIPVTPRMTTLGPRLRLAQELLQRGEKQSVMEFLERARNINQLPEVQAQLKLWKEQIAKGETPLMK